MKKLSTDLKENKFEKVYLFYGEEEYLKSSYRKQFVDQIVAGNDMNLSVYENTAPEVEEIMENADTAPFFGEYRLVILENSGLFNRECDDLCDYLDKIPETTIILFIEKKADKRKKLFKKVQKLGYICEMNKQNEKQLSPWVGAYLKKNSKNITVKDASYFLGNVGLDMSTISNELDKLISYVGKRDTITKRDIDAVCIKQLNVRIFDMIDALSVRNKEQTLKSYYELIADKEPPARILFMIARQFTLILQAKDLSNRGMSRAEIGHIMNVQDFIVRKCISQSHNFTVADLKHGLESCVELDSQIKNGLINDQIGVEMLLVNMM